jgi:hypothetical protein
MKLNRCEFDAQISELCDVWRGFRYVGSQASIRAQNVLKAKGWEMLSIIPHSVHIDPNGSVSYHYPIKIKRDTSKQVAYLIMCVTPDNFTWFCVVAKSNVNGCIVKKHADAVRRKLEEASMVAQARPAKRSIKKCTRKKATKAATRCLISNRGIRKLRCTMEKLGCKPEPSGKKLTSKQDDKKIVKAFKKRK